LRGAKRLAPDNLPRRAPRITRTPAVSNIARAPRVYAAEDMNMKKLITVLALGLAVPSIAFAKDAAKPAAAAAGSGSASGSGSGSASGSGSGSATTAKPKSTTKPKTTKPKATTTKAPASTDKPATTQTK
jgi:hypothetical protein